MSLVEIEAARAVLPREQQQQLLEHLVKRLHAAKPAPVPSEAPVVRHSVLDIPAVSVGSILQPFTSDADLLEEMLEGRRF